ncbi:hypothetical protein BDP55DRAFT_651360 [Colletotrichum godetiae]|uniref:Secreted protein n=1 Tax=Colletotrichum godetiae TaxID=1209918 RepID=A0AAJ0EWB5_9PEZI|nr:uncharacterized protein BDP55DRAFT_651360 [Colletotrichum godetiae]KAK1689724.1 hypothetical protein BDP55DRAFT_651360 [Colletotrichum godetiae]
MWRCAAVAAAAAAILHIACHAPGPSQIRQEIPECYQEPLSIVYLHHVSSDSRVFQPHYVRLWLNTVLLTMRPAPLPHGPGTKRVGKKGAQRKTVTSLSRNLFPGPVLMC